MVDLIRHLILSCVNQHRIRSQVNPEMTGSHFLDSLFLFGINRFAIHLPSRELPAPA